MDKQKMFWGLLTLIIGGIVLAIVINLVFVSDKINEGKFRVSDAILTSSAELTSKTEQNNKWSVNVSQRNQLSLLITPASEAKIAKIYLTDLKVEGTNNIVFYMLNSENKLHLDNNGQKLDVEYLLDENNQIKLEFVALNENMLKNWEVPENIKEIIYDGRIFKTAGMTLKDIQFKLSFKLNIVEQTTGKINVMKVKMTLPNEELMTNGADVRRLSLQDFKFKVN